MAKIVKRTLPCSLTADEYIDRADALAVAALERHEAKLALDSAAEAWRERKKELEADLTAKGMEVRRLGRIVRDRKESREVDCAVRIQGSTYWEIRTDTGEVHIQRAATGEELQASLFVEDPQDDARPAS